MGFPKPVINDGIMQHVKSQHLFSDHIIVIPQGAEFLMNGKVFKWCSDGKGGIILTNLPVVNHIEVKITFAPAE